MKKSILIEAEFFIRRKIKHTLLIYTCRWRV